MQTQDQLNHTAWIDPAGVSWLARLEGFTDEGEREAYRRIEAEARGAPILDLGVGGGRTVSLLRALSTDYVAIDYTDVLVDAARRRYPGVDIRLGDARDLSQFADGTFGLVVFSYMGIDSVGREDRRRILREVRRVLRPGGTFWFSTLNITGAAPRRRPWQVRLKRADEVGSVRRAIDLSRTLKRVPRETLNYLRGRRHGTRGQGWEIAPFFAYAYALLVHYTTLDDQLAELVEAGFRPGAEVIDDVRGVPVAQGQDLSGTFCFNVLARV
ncbi:MAG: class I SAM-dependent methyltransferase [Polyangiales bacterium]